MDLNHNTTGVESVCSKWNYKVQFEGWNFAYIQTMGWETCQVDVHVQ